jgi:hypothetical protein
VIQGNERVVRPRLADAKFFFDQDRKKTLASRVPSWPRWSTTASWAPRASASSACARSRAASAAQLGGGALAEQADRAALLAKADLLTDMVGEFPELQGIMGGYYARHDGEREAVAWPSKTTTSRVLPATRCRAAKSGWWWRWPTSWKPWPACSASASCPPATRTRLRCAATRWA